MFCFPYAGGGASIYRRWGQALWPLAELYAVQLPGREERISQPRYYSIPKLAQALINEAFFDENQIWFSKPFVLFGHSMGAKIVFELSRRLEEMKKKPALVIASGCLPPCFPATRRIHDLPDERFMEELRHLAGTPEEILRDKAFMDMYRPLLRADFTMDETYENNSVLDIPFVAIGGKNDREAGVEFLDDWKRLTSGPFHKHSLNGDHFFIKKEERALLDIVKMELKAVA
jgi:surfactin synthase thioesterase subunit